MSTAPMQELNVLAVIFHSSPQCSRGINTWRWIFELLAILFVIIWDPGRRGCQVINIHICSRVELFIVHVQKKKKKITWVFWLKCRFRMSRSWIRPTMMYFLKKKKSCCWCFWFINHHLSYKALRNAWNFDHDPSSWRDRF